jgi:antitoxin VapB
MAFRIKSDEADQLARQLTAITGESITTAVTLSLRERLTRQQLTNRPRIERMQSVLDRIHALPVVAERSEQDIFGWDDLRLPM